MTGDWVNRWLGQAARRFWRYFGGDPPEAEVRLRRRRPDGLASSPSPSAPAAPAAADAADAPKQRRGYADKMVHSGDYADKGRPW